MYMEPPSALFEFYDKTIVPTFGAILPTVATRSRFPSLANSQDNSLRHLRAGTVSMLVGSQSGKIQVPGDAHSQDKT